MKNHLFQLPEYIPSTPLRASTLFSRSTKWGSEEKLEKLAVIQMKLDKMPQYQRFLLLSVADSFTDIHVDASATSVFYHVVKVSWAIYIDLEMALELVFFGFHI